MSVIERSDPSTSTPADIEEAVLLEWTVHLLRRDPRRAWVVFAAMAFAAGMGYLFFGSALFALIGALMIFSATAEYLLPIRYRLTTRRACAAYGAARLEIPWEGVRRVLTNPAAVKLSPLSAASRLDAFRGVLLRFAADGETGNRDEVLRIVQEMVLTPSPSPKNGRGEVEMPEAQHDA